MELKAFIELMRPRQWFKSLYIIFGAIPAIFLTPFRPLLIPWLLLLGIINMILIQGTIYTINDITDVEKDKLHPKKKNRPLPSGKINKVVCPDFIFDSICNGNIHRPENSNHRRAPSSNKHGLFYKSHSIERC